MISHSCIYCARNNSKYCIWSRVYLRLQSDIISIVINPAAGLILHSHHMFNLGHSLTHQHAATANLQHSDNYI